MTEQALALHGDVVGLGDLLAEGLGLGSAEADTGDIQAVLQSTLSLTGQLGGVPTVMTHQHAVDAHLTACFAKVAFLA